MLLKLKRAFALLCAGFTGLVLLAACLLAFFLAKIQIERAALDLFENQSQSLSVLLAGAGQLDHSRLYRMEKESGVTIHLFDNGSAVSIAGTGTGGRRAALYGAALAELAAKNAGVSVSPEERSEAPVNLSGAFCYGGGSYLAKYISSPLGARQWYAVVLIKPDAETGRAVGRTALLYAGIFLFGLGLLFLVSWALAKRSVKPVEDAQAKQREFMAAASHELKSPLAVIASSADVLESAGGDLRMCCQNIRGEAKRMSNLVEDMLLLAGAETGRWRIKKAAANPEDILAAAYERFLPLAMDKDIGLSLSLPDENLPAITADEERMIQVLGILLSNAVGYSPPGSKVVLAGRANRRALVFSVQDNGPGIAQEDKAHIFDSFYRGRQPRGDKSHFGLGLAVAKELVLLHGGALALSDAPGGGARFVVTLPRMRGGASPAG